MSKGEPDALPNLRPRASLKRTVLSCLILSICVTWLVVHRWPQPTRELAAELCPQSSALVPESKHELWHALNAVISASEFERQAADWLGGSVRIPTVTYDNLGPVGEDERWNIHAKQHKYLLKAFPLVHASLKLEKVNTYGLLYTWQGSDASLKPVLLMAHQDVVPVDPTTVDQWSHPPFSGHFDGKRIWGRGSSDDKSGLISILVAIELLLENNFQPTRSYVLAFGFDEEGGGFRGAAELSKVVIDRYGEDSFAFVIDEGGGFGELFGSVFATPGIAEKGSMNVKVEVATAGGHSSVPPAHTSIGILAALLVHFEENPFEVHIARESSTYSAFQCYAQHGKTIDKDLRKTIKKSVKSDKALRDLESIVLQNNNVKSLVGTTQAIDMIEGGVKSNALPEQAWAIVNHRISTQSSVAETKEHDTTLLKELASKFNLSYSAFGEHLSEEGAPSKGTLTLSSPRELQPAPVTPTDAAPYQLLSGTIKSTFNAHRSLVGDDHIAVSPGMPTGNTDTRFYWPLSRHIYRYTHYNLGSGTFLDTNMHTVNEYIEVDTLAEMIRFFVTLILNADESTSI